MNIHIYGIQVAPQKRKPILLYISIYIHIYVHISSCGEEEYVICCNMQVPEYSFIYIYINVSFAAVCRYLNIHLYIFMSFAAICRYLNIHLYTFI